MNQQQLTLLKQNQYIVLFSLRGERTAQYIDFVLTRLTVVGSIYLVLVCLLPEFLISRFAVPFYFGGTSVLIIVNVAMDTMTQFHEIVSLYP